MNVLVTGGAGFIGSHLVEELLAQEPGAKIRVFDNLTSGKEANLAHLPKDSFQLIRGDIRDPAALKLAIQGVDVVFHHAALTSVQGSIRDPGSSNDVNISGTTNVFTAAREAGVRRVVFASSSAVYGENPTSPKSEDLLPDCISPYAVSKLCGETYARYFARIHGLDSVCFRYFNVFGPRQDPNSQYAAVIPKFIDAVLAGRPPRVFGDGEQTRDFIFVKDIVRANVLAARTSLKGSLVLNVGTGKSFSLNILLNLLKKILGKDPGAIHEAAVPGDVKHSLADISAIKKTLGFEPKHSFEEALRITLESFQHQPMSR